MQKDPEEGKGGRAEGAPGRPASPEEQQLSGREVRPEGRRRRRRRESGAKGGVTLKALSYP